MTLEINQIALKNAVYKCLTRHAGHEAASREYRKLHRWLIKDADLSEASIKRALTKLPLQIQMEINNTYQANLYEAKRYHQNRRVRIRNHEKLLAA